MNAAEYDYIRNLVRTRSAIVLDDGKEYLIQARLGPVARQEGVESIEHLVARMRSLPEGALHSRVVEAMTTNETSFFRDVNPFEVLRQKILPEVIKQRAQERTLNLWSAACSTGQEPYTMAMLLRQHFPELATWKVRILATDLSTHALDRARKGRFSQLEVNRGLPASMLIKYFQAEGMDWQIKPELKELIEFRQMNLATMWPALPRMDVVFMRNVLIYFDIPTKKAILGRLKNVLGPQGCLFLGAAETTFNIDSSFVSVEMLKTIYYRRATG